ncbi:protein transport protein sec31-like [Punica granatum]|uniref:Protein transport protein sec31-like n=1 Tax=Punica granatum TaxID=22663 RepID=A0A6P8DA76_PUNGR|nr:protein transport protein sec31-like [Punica granatum]
MAEGDRVNISEEVNPPVPAHSQPPPMHAPPPPTPAGILPAYSGAPPTHLPPPTSSGAPLPPVSLTSSVSDDQARITALEGTVNQMATNMAKLLALLRGPNRASSSSTSPPGQGPTVDPTPRVPPTQALENMDAPAPPTLHASMAHPFTSPYPPPPAPTAVPLPPATFQSSEQALSAPPPISIPVPAAAYTAPPTMVFPASSAPALTHPQAAELPPYSSLQPHVGLSYQAPPPINTTFHELGMLTHAAQFASPMHFFPDADVEQERRLNRMDETIRALQLLAGDQIRPISPGPNFDPSVQDQSKRCEYHQSAPGHTLDNCWRLRDEIQRRIDSNRLTFNAVRPPNVQDNPLSDHRPNSGSSINMISICASGRDEDTQDNPLPFVIDYTPEEPTAGFTGNVASPAPFVIDIPAREPYSDGKVPWTYEGSIRSVEQQFSVMGVTRSGRVYENPAARDKGKAPATEIGTTPESSPFSSKRVIEEEAEAFMKIVKASEYKVVEQMAKSPAISHCSPSSSARNRTEKPSSGY